MGIIQEGFEGPMMMNQLGREERGKGSNGKYMWQLESGGEIWK